MIRDRCGGLPGVAVSLWAWRTATENVVSFAESCREKPAVQKRATENEDTVEGVAYNGVWLSVWSGGHVKGVAYSMEWWVC